MPRCAVSIASRPRSRAPTVVAEAEVASQSTRRPVFGGTGD